MERNVTMAEISDGKLYSRDDMVKVGCDDCRLFGVLPRNG